MNFVGAFVYFGSFESTLVVLSPCELDFLFLEINLEKFWTFVCLAISFVNLIMINIIRFAYLFSCYAEQDMLWLLMFQETKISLVWTLYIDCYRIYRIVLLFYARRSKEILPFFNSLTFLLLPFWCFSWCYEVLKYSKGSKKSALQNSKYWQVNCISLNSSSHSNFYWVCTTCSNTCSLYSYKKLLPALSVLRVLN